MKETRRPSPANAPDLPFLRGFGTRSDDRPRPRLQTMDYSNGIPVPKEAVDAQCPIARLHAIDLGAESEHDASPAVAQFEEARMEEEERVVRAVDAFKTRPSPAALRPFVPDFVLKDKVVLVFAGYFAEAVKEKEEAPAAGRPTGLPSNASNARGASNASAASTSNPLIGPSGVPSLSVPRSVHPWVAAHPQAKPWATDEPKPVPAAVVQQPIYTPAPPAKPNIIKPSTQIIRRIVLSFFVEDGSLAIVEPKRGPLVSRQKVPRNLADRRIYIEEKDLDLGREIEVYGKKIVLCDADEFTKHYYSTTLRRPLHPAVPLPEDSLAPTKPAPSPRAAQAAVDGPHNDPLARFLLYDRSVLRFFGVWLENGKPTQKEVILHLYLVDDTVEVREVRRRDDGGEGGVKVPIMLKRGPLPKEFNKLEDLTMAPRYTWRDLHPGLTLSILGRPVLLKDCDAFTRAFLRAHLGLEESELAPIDTTTPSPEPVQNPLPPYTGFGTEEDSEQSCRRLVLRAPAKDLTKLLSLHNLTLGFLAVPSESDPIPRRKFVVTYHLSDDTIAITEPALKTLGSKRLDRTKVPRPGRSVGDAADPATRYYTWPELKIGSEFVAFGFGYRIVDCDGFAIDWFAKHGLLDLESVRVRAKQVFSRLDKEGKKVFERELRSLDTDKDWTCERGKFLEAVGRALAMEGMELHSLAEPFRKQGHSDRIGYVKFLEAFVWEPVKERSGDRDQ